MCNFERTLNIHPPFVVSVAVLIVDIHKSRAVTLYLIKYLILIRGVGGEEFIRYDVTTRDVLETM